MQGYWHIVALSVAGSAISVIVQGDWVILLFLLWLTLLYYKKRLKLFPFFFSLAFLLFFNYYIPAKEVYMKDEVPSEPIVISGKIKGPPIKPSKTVRFILQDKESKLTYQGIYFTKDSKDSLPLKVKYGAYCNIRGKVQIPRKSRNPGQFNYQEYLATQGISYELIVESSKDLRCKGASFLDSVYQFREKLINKVKDALNETTASWLMALVLGEQDLIDDEIKELFQRWGLSHLLAISGLHVGIVVTLLYFLSVHLNFVTKETGQWLILCFLPFYAILAGGEPSVLRASAMVVLFLILNQIKIHYQQTDIISIVFVILIAFDPFMVYHIGFQFSFIITFALLLSKRWIQQSETPVGQLFKISYISQMVILPLQFNYFHAFQPLSILLNLVVVPYFSLLVIPLMFLLLLTLLVLPSIAKKIDPLFSLIHEPFKYLLIKADHFFDYPIILSDFPLSVSILYYAFLIVSMIYVEKHHLKRAFQFGCLVIALIVCLWIRPYLSPVGKVTMLDIGQAEAIVVELPFRKGVFMIDAGTELSFPNFEATKETFDQILQPYLYAEGISKLDAIILSHNDLDHSGSVPYVIERFPVSTIYISKYFGEINEEIKKWQKKNISVKELSFNEIFKIGGYAFQVLSPRKNMGNDNDNSLVLKTKIGGKTWLFTGDISSSVEKSILRNFPNLSADILKVAHHGSHTSSDPTFIKQLNPSYALISAGLNNHYNHPSNSVIETFEKEHVIVLRTDEFGALQFIFADRKEGTFFTFLPYNK